MSRAIVVSPRTSRPDVNQEDIPGRLAAYFPPAKSRYPKPDTYSQSMTAAGILIATAALTMVLAGSPAGSVTPEGAAQVTEATAKAIKQWSFEIMPLAGSLLASAGICLLHNVQEGKGKIAGRVIFALIGGFVVPWAVELLPITWKINDPRAQLLLGVIAGSCGYIFSRYVVEVVFKKAPAISERMVDHAERKLDEHLKD